MALGVEELALKLLCSLKLVNNPSLDSSHCRVITRFFIKKPDFPSLYETCQPLELVHLTSNSLRFENNKVDSFTCFYNFQYQECVIQIMHVDCEYNRSFQYEPVGSRGLIHLGSSFSTCLTYWLEKFLSSYLCLWFLYMLCKADLALRYRDILLTVWSCSLWC